MRRNQGFEVRNLIRKPVLLVAVTAVTVSSIGAAFGAMPAYAKSVREPALHTPAIKASRVATTKTSVKWTKVSGASSYRVFETTTVNVVEKGAKKTVEKTETKAVANVASKTSAVTVSSASNEKVCYTVEAFGRGFKSSVSGKACVSIVTPKPAPTTTTTVAPTTTTTVAPTTTTTVAPTTTTTVAPTTTTTVAPTTTTTVAPTTTTTVAPTTTITSTGSSSALPAGVPSSLSLTFDDEFNGTSVNTNYWDPAGFWYSQNSGSGGGADLDTSSQVTESGGFLNITAVRQATSGTDYTWLSGSVNSSPNGASTGAAFSPPFYVQFGAILPPSGAGLWPALWLLHNGGSYQEADLMESIGNSTQAYATWHPNGTDSDGQEYSAPGNADLSASEHTYGAYITATSLQWYLDGQPVGSPIAISDPGSFFLVMDLAVGDAGSWPGAADASTPSPAVFKIDYVRVYQ